MSWQSAPVDEQLSVLMRGTEFGDEETRRTMEQELRERLDEGRPLRVYCGYDPTSVDLHLGSTVTFRKLRQFQDFGHRVTFLIGNFTGLVGDPSDKDKARPMLSPEQLESNSKTYANQAFRLLDPQRTDVAHNADWLSKLTFADVIRLCSHFTVAQFIERDNFANRWQQHDAIHISEFMYAIMQGYDAVALETDVQVGGTDQLFNLLAGRVLQREYGQRPQVAITTPILVGTDGKQKMSKSAGNYIAVDDVPNDMYGKVMSVPDAAMEAYFTLLTSLTSGDISSILESVKQGTLPPIDAKKRLAFEVTADMYARAEAESAQLYFESIIQRREVPQEMQEYSIPDYGSDDHSRLDKVLVSSGIANSGGEVRRLVEQRAISVNGDRVTEFTVLLKPGDEVKVGNHRFIRVVG